MSTRIKAAEEDQNRDSDKNVNLKCMFFLFVFFCIKMQFILVIDKVIIYILHLSWK